MKFVFNYFTSPSFRLTLNYRIGRWLLSHPNLLSKVIARWYLYRQITKRNCHISYLCEIGKNVSFPHPIGIVIGDRVKVGDNTKIWQNVTLGSHGKVGEELAYPTIGSGVKIYEGATIIGNVTVGNNAIIGAKSLVTKDVPPSTIAYGIPAKVKEKN